MRFRFSDAALNAERFPEMTYVGNILGDKLSVDWKKFKLHDDVSKLDIPLCSALNVPLVNRRALKRMLKQPLSLRIMLGSTGVYEAFPIQCRDETTWDCNAANASYEGGMLV